MLDLAEQIARVVDDAAAPVTADEARGRARHGRRRAPVLAGVVVLVVVLGVASAVSVLGHRDRTGARVVVRAGPTTTTVAPSPTAPGSLVGTLAIPVIGVDSTVDEGSSLAIERLGPMHDPATPLPGANGNSVIVGFRTTHGAPFNRINELVARHATITFTTPDGRSYSYVVDGSFVVPGHGTAVPASVIARLRDRQDSLTLVTDNPRYSAAQRLIVTAHQDQARPPDLP